MVLLQFEQQDKVLFHFVGLTYWVAHVSRYLLCFVLSMNYLEASKIENGLEAGMSCLSQQSQSDV